jgi:hypothetical protein
MSLKKRSNEFGAGFSMSRPEYIARVHAARYDLRTCDQNDEPEMLRNYNAALAAAARIAGCSEAALKLALASDYRVWLKQEGLPPIDRNKP